MNKIALMIASSLFLSTVGVSYGKEINVVTYGGSWGEAQQRAMFDPFTEQTGIKVNVIPNSDYALSSLRAQSLADNNLWDVINLRPEAISIACLEGLLENFDIDEVLLPSTNGILPSQDFFNEFQVDCGAPQILYSIQFGYNKDAYGDNPPTTVADVFDIEKFPGKRGLQNRPFNNLEWALIADGVNREEVRDILATNEGLDRAFSVMDRIKNHIVWWDKAATGIQHLVSGEVDIAANYNGRFWTAMQEEGVNLDVIWDHQIYTVTNWVVPTGQMSPEVIEFLQFTTSTETLANISRLITYGPARRSSVSLNEGNWTHFDTGVDMQFAMPTYSDNMDTAFSRDGEWWSTHGERILERWDMWMLQ